MTVSPKLGLTLALVAGASVAVPAWIVTHPPRLPPPRSIVVRRHVVPQAVLPPVEPVSFVDLSPEDARAYNAGVPFSTGPNPAARPYRYGGEAEDRARATDCLAAAEVYEAGDDTTGEKAVAQVVLNRLRHPAFPKTVCGVVFEGAERSTGCQFTFSCDGALTRWKPSDAAWRRAREVAEQALAGAVYRPIGYSTHYHTDWVVPYWQSSLDKVAAVGAHLFFRWSGWWGTPPAFNRQLSRGEPVIEKLAALSDAHRTGTALDEAGAAIDQALAATGTTAPQPLPDDPDSFLATLPAGTTPDLLPVIAASACGGRDYCKFSAWRDSAKTPKSLPLSPAQVATMTFSYFRDRPGGIDKALWNCAQIKRADPAQCMRQQVLGTVSAPPPIPTILPTPARGPLDLDGVRRRGGQPQPLRPTPTPTVKPTASPPPTDYRS